MQSSADIRFSKVVIFSENPPQSLISCDQTISPVSLIYHGLEQDATQQVFWNETPSVSEGEDLYVIALWGGVDAALNYVITSAWQNPHVLVIDDKEQDLSLLQEGVILNYEFKQKQPKSCGLMGKPSRESSFLEALYLCANDQQVFIFQRMLKFLQDAHLRFKPIESQLQWRYKTTFKTATTLLREESLHATDGFAYDDLYINRPFCYQYDPDLAESAKQGIVSKTVELPNHGFFKQKTPAILGGVALTVVMGLGIAFGLHLGVMLLLMAAITVTATYTQYQSGASTKAPHS